MGGFFFLPVKKFWIQKIFAIAMLEILVDCSVACNQYTSHLMRPNGIMNHIWYKHTIMLPSIWHETRYHT